MRVRTFLAICSLSVVTIFSPLYAGPIIIGGSGTDLGTFKLLAEAFTELHPDSAITILPSMGSSGGIKALKHNKINLALTSRPLKESENTADIKATHYASTPMVIAVASTSPQQQITREQVIKIYTGELKRWPDGSPARPILRPSKDSDTKILINSMAHSEQEFMRAYQRRGVPVALTDQESADLIARVPGALGTSTLSLILSENKPIKALKLDGVSATANNLFNKSYPMYKKLYFTVKKDSSKNSLNAFIQFIYSEKGQSILMNTGHLTIR